MAKKRMVWVIVLILSCLVNWGCAPETGTLLMDATAVQLEAYLISSLGQVLTYFVYNALDLPSTTYSTSWTTPSTTTLSGI